MGRWGNVGGGGAVELDGACTLAHAVGDGGLRWGWRDLRFRDLGVGGTGAAGVFVECAGAIAV